jgi:integrase
VPAQFTLDLGMTLMDTALDIPRSARKEREVQYRDGLIIALLSLWPIRRRSIAALSVARHLELSPDRADIQLFPEDTKSRRHESWPVPDALLPYLHRYLHDIRPRLVGRSDHEALWPSLKGGSLGAGQIYTMVRRRTEEAFGRSMGLHDFRRAAATFLAMEAPEKVGLTPGILGHANADVGDRHYNLARTVTASRRHLQTVSAVKARLRSPVRT